jgi:predicted nucleic acid-binding Zn ribbon protein
MRSERTVRIDDLIDSLLRQRRWQSGMQTAKLKSFWAELVGPEIAAHTQPDRIYGKRLVILCDHDVWRTELQYLEPELLKRIAEGMGEGVVKEIWLK